MKIGFLVPVNGLKKYESMYLSIVSFLNQNGHEVIHPLVASEIIIHKWTSEERNVFFNNYYARVNTSDVVIAECSYPCVSIGYEIANIIQQGKEVIILKTKETDLISKNFDSLYTKKNIYIYEYEKYNLKDILQEAISFRPNQKYKKYNILLTSKMIAKLDAVAKKKNLHKSAYIRQLIEKGLEKDI